MQDRPNAELNNELDPQHPDSPYWLIKSIRGDEYCFWRSTFVLGVTRSSEQQETHYLRDPPRKYAVYADGVYENPNMPAACQLTEEEKNKYSLAQSTSLVVKDELHPPVFGLTTSRANALIGVCIHASDTKIIRCFTKDTGTISRPYEFNNKDKAEKYWKTVTELGAKIRLVKDLLTLKKELLQIENIKYNEVMAKLSWNKDTSKICIFNDTLEARLLAQEYARTLRTHLKAQAKEEGKVWDANFAVPICYYLPNHNPPRIFDIYTKEEQAADILEAKNIADNHILRNKKIFNRDYEFLLGLEDTSEILWKFYFSTEYSKKISLLQLFLNTRHYHIIEALLEKDYLLISQNIHCEVRQKDLLHAIKNNYYMQLKFYLSIFKKNNEILTKESVQDLIFYCVSSLGARPSKQTLDLLDISNCHPSILFLKDMLNYTHTHHSEWVGKLANTKFENKTLLYQAVSTNNILLVKYLLAIPSLDVNRQVWGRTALMLAADQGNVKLVKILLANPKIDVRKSSWGLNRNNPLTLAAKNGHYEIVKLLLNHNQNTSGLDVNRQVWGQTLLMSAAQQGNMELVKILLAHPKIDVRKSSWGSDNAFTLAVKNNHFYVAKMLLTHSKVPFQEHDERIQKANEIHNFSRSTVRKILLASAALAFVVFMVLTIFSVGGFSLAGFATGLSILVAAPFIFSFALKMRNKFFARNLLKSDIKNPVNNNQVPSETTPLLSTAKTKEILRACEKVPQKIETQDVENEEIDFRSDMGIENSDYESDNENVEVTSNDALTPDPAAGVGFPSGFGLFNSTATCPTIDQSLLTKP